MVLATIEVNTSAAQNVFAASIPTSPTFQKAEYSKSWHNLEQSNLCCNLADDQSLDIKLNPHATEKHKPNQRRKINPLQISRILSIQVCQKQ